MNCSFKGQILVYRQEKLMKGWKDDANNAQWGLGPYSILSVASIFSVTLPGYQSLLMPFQPFLCTIYNVRRMDVKEYLCRVFPI